MSMILWNSAKEMATIVDRYHRAISRNIDYSDAVLGFAEWVPTA